MKSKRRPTSIRLSTEGKRLQALLAIKLGVSRTAVLELAVRVLAKQEGIERNGESPQ